MTLRAGTIRCMASYVRGGAEVIVLSTAYCLLSTLACPASAQSLSQKGFVELRGTGYAQEAPADTSRAVAEVLVRHESSFRPASWLTVSGSIDLRGDTHEQTSDDWSPDWEDRGVQRPRLSIRRLGATFTRGPVTLDVGKQFIRWGKADVLNPTDRFAPRDYLNVTDSEFLAVTGARAVVGQPADSLDVVFVPRFTPSRAPLATQRWAPGGDVPANVTVIDAGRVFPDGAQVGARWNHVGQGLEFSLSGYRGFNHTPSIESLATIQIFPPVIAFAQFYPRIWMAGGDAALPLRHVTLKGEAAYFGTDDARVDEYWIYVIQIERQAGEWFFVGGYAGEVVTSARQARAFSPERGLTKAFLGRAGYTIDTNRSIAFEGAVRQNLEGSWLRAEFSQASGQHLRFTVQGSWLRGNADDFLGRYRRNSHVTASVRYSY